MVFDALRQAVAISPDNIPLLFLFARTCLDQWLLEEGHAIYERILELAPDHIEAKMGIAQSLYLAGKTSEAIVRVESILLSQPEYAPGWILLSRLFFVENDIQLAKSYYKKARQLNPRLMDLALEKDLYPELHPSDASFSSQESAAVGSSLPTSTKASTSSANKRSHEENAKNARAFLSTSSVNNEEYTNDSSTQFHEDEPLLEEIQKEALDYLPLQNPLDRTLSNFDQVGGMEEVKEAIRMKILYPLENPTLFRAYGKKAGGGILMYGPPGCGKTLLAQAIAGEIHSSFISIGIHQILDLYLGNSEKNLHGIFQLAREHSPCVLFFDEIDALTGDRNDVRHATGATLTNQFLAELDGSIANNEGLLVLGATNAPWRMDPAFERPGRFDKIIFVPPPDANARVKIIELLSEGKPIHQKLDIDLIVEKTANFSGSDLNDVFDKTIDRLLLQAVKKKRIIPLTTEELLITIEAFKPSVSSWFDNFQSQILPIKEHRKFSEETASYFKKFKKHFEPSQTTS